MAANTPGRLVADRYRLSRRIGRGGAGEVWRATDTLLDRDVALKILHRRLVGAGEAAGRFRREAVAAAGLNHPNVVVVHDIGEDDEDIYLVMELIDGPTLAVVIGRSAPLDPRAVTAVAHQVAGGLGAAHGRGLVHRDVKPANVLLTSNGTAKVADFGIAKALGGAQASLTQPGEVVGTASYLAPEQLSGQTVEPCADVYALGVVMFEALTGERAFSGETVTEVAVSRFSVPALRPRERRPDVPADLDEVVARATLQEPDGRYPDGDALAAALQRLPGAGDRGAVLRLVRPGGGRPGGAPPGGARPAPPRDTGTRPLREEREERDEREATAAVGAAPDRRGGEPGPGAAPDADERGWPRWTAVLPLLLLVAVGGLLAVRALTGGDGGGGAGGGQPRTLPIADASDLDPFGDDGREHPEDVPKAHDGDAGTAWTTSRYNSPDFGGLKSGVGLAFELAEVRPVQTVRVHLATPGIDLELYALDGAPRGDPSDWGEPVATVEDAPEVTDVPVEGREARHWVVWVTRLSGSRARVAEVTFLAG